LRLFGIHQIISYILNIERVIPAAGDLSFSLLEARRATLPQAPLFLCALNVSANDQTPQLKIKN
jgi:hypothetical protein